MPVRVLVADDNLDVQELVNDIILINFKDAAVERVLDADAFRAKIIAANPAYDLVIVASSLADASGKNIVSIVCEEFPDSIARVIILENDTGYLPADPTVNIMQIVKRPFSLDDFGDRIRKIYPGLTAGRTGMQKSERAPQ
jgi:hypothetical protein